MGLFVKLSSPALKINKKITIFLHFMVTFLLAVPNWRKVILKTTDSFRFWAISFIKSLRILIINFGLVICSSSANNVVLTRNMTGRRTKLPCPRPDTESLSLWNLLCKNIGKDLSQVSMPVALNEPLNMLQVGCLFFTSVVFYFYKGFVCRGKFQKQRLGLLVLATRWNAVSVMYLLSSSMRGLNFYYVLEIKLLQCVSW